MTRLGQPCSADDIAAQLDLHMLFETEPYSFAEFITEQRLVRAQTALTDPRQLNRRIGEIAADAGFVDIRAFNRNFLRRFSMTPTEAREKATPIAAGTQRKYPPSEKRRSQGHSNRAVTRGEDRQ